MREYTEIQIANLDYNAHALVEDKAWVSFEFEDRRMSRAIMGGRVVAANEDIITCETQGSYTGVGLEAVNSGTAVEVFFDNRKSRKLGDGIIHRRYFVKAKSSDWEISETLGADSKSIAVDFTFTEEEKELLSYGFRPLSMDDKWFVYVEADTIHLVRSWTGIEVFQAKFIPAEHKTWRIEALNVRSDEQYSSMSNASLFGQLIRGRLLSMKKLHGLKG